MTPIKTQKYKSEYGAELLRIAEGDLASAIALRETHKGRKENVGYLAQQSIEKSIKAVLCFLGVAIPHTHELAALIPLISPSLNCPFGLEISDLSQFATIRRYMEGNYEIDDDEIGVSIEVAEKMFAWARGIVK
jgi:HEPN domain-containing protein